jgi:hypothetical protein
MARYLAIWAVGGVRGVGSRPERQSWHRDRHPQPIHLARHRAVGSARSTRRRPIIKSFPNQLIAEVEKRQER